MPPFQEEKGISQGPCPPRGLCGHARTAGGEKELLGSVQALLKDDRLKGARITDTLTH